MILSDGTASISLPDTEFIWADELTHDPVTQSTERTITGALVVELWKEVAGRPVTLAPSDNNHGWLLRSDWLALKAWADEPGKALMLTVPTASGTESFGVIFSRPAIEAEPLFGHSWRDGNEYWRGTLRFLTV